MFDFASEKLKEYKKCVAKRLATLIPILRKVAMGDFTAKVEISKKEDEFTELLVTLDSMIDDLQKLERTRREAEEANVAAAAAERALAEKMAKELKKKVQERTRELAEKVAELEEWREVTTGRELKMMELKREIKKLRTELKKK